MGEIQRKSEFSSSEKVSIYDQTDGRSHVIHRGIKVATFGGIITHGG